MFISFCRTLASRLWYPQNREWRLSRKTQLKLVNMYEDRRTTESSSRRIYCHITLCVYFSVYSNHLQMWGHEGSPPWWGGMIKRWSQEEIKNLKVWKSGGQQQMTIEKNEKLSRRVGMIWAWSSVVVIMRSEKSGTLSEYQTWLKSEIDKKSQNKVNYLRILLFYCMTLFLWRNFSFFQNIRMSYNGLPDVVHHILEILRDARRTYWLRALISM